MSSTNNKSRVAVQSKLTVVSSIPVEPGKTHRLSPLDHSMGLHTFHIIFYYPKNPGRSFDTDRIRVSLSEVLSLYPVITGRLTRAEDGNWEVKCNDAGIRILKAKVCTTLDEWLRSANWWEERDLTVWEHMPDDPKIWSPFRIQITDFEGGGLAIGLSCTHLQVDPTCATLFFKSWTEAHLGEPILHPLSFEPISLAGPPVPNTNTKSAKYYASKAKAKPPPTKMATATFKFSASKIKQGLSELHDKCPNATPFHLLVALFWTRVVRSKPVTHGHHQFSATHSLSICVDFRKLTHPPLPYGYFGNAQHFTLLSISDEEMEAGGLAHVTGLVNRHVSSVEEEEFWSVINWLESQKDETGKLAPPFRMYGPELTCVSMEHTINENESLIYSTMFEKDAKPLHVSCHIENVEGEGLIIVMPSPEGGLGRIVTVTLPEEQVSKLCNDQGILQMEPTMLLGGR